MGVGAAGVSINSKSSDVSDTAADISMSRQLDQTFDCIIQLNFFQEFAKQRPGLACSYTKVPQHPKVP